MANNVVPCTGALTAVASLNDNNQFVGVHPDGAFIYNLTTKTLERIERVEDSFELELEVVPYEAAKQVLEPSGFQRRPGRA